MIEALRQAWNRYWFAPEAALNLAVARVLAAGTAFWVLLSREPSGVSGLGAAFWAGVPASTRWRFLLFPGHEPLEHVLVLIAAAALLGALVGVRPRLCCFVAAVLLYHLAPLESIIWSPSPEARGLTLPTLALLLCGVAPSGDALAVGSGPPPGRSWVYGWPLRLLQVWLIEVYVFADLAKLRLSGLAWASWENMSNWLYVFTQSEGHAVYRQLGGWIAARPILAGTVGVGTMIFEFGVIVALFSKRWRPWVAVSAILFHFGIYFALNITLNSWPLLLTFFDWDRWLRIGGDAGTPAASPAQGRPGGG